MEQTLTLYDTSIGKKTLVALTGLVLFGFVILHMLGNLQVFLGPEALNAYARGLRKIPALLWGLRVVLLGSVVVHITVSLSLVKQSAQARAAGYRVQRSLVTTYAARTMKWTGPLLAAFIVFHLAHFTWPGVAVGAYAYDPHDVYANVVHGFRVPWVVAIYLVAQALLGLHLYHGAWSLFQTLGLNHPRYTRLSRDMPVAIAMVVVICNAAMPVAVLVGIVR